MDIIILVIVMLVVGLIIGWLAGPIWKNRRPIAWLGLWVTMRLQRVTGCTHQAP